MSDMTHLIKLKAEDAWLLQAFIKPNAMVMLSAPYTNKDITNFRRKLVLCQLALEGGEKEVAMEVNEKDCWIIDSVFNAEIGRDILMQAFKALWEMHYNIPLKDGITDKAFHPKMLEGFERDEMDDTSISDMPYVPNDDNPETGTPV